jgi:hypothetical protein
MKTHLIRGGFLFFKAMLIKIALALKVIFGAKNNRILYIFNTE